MSNGNGTSATGIALCPFDRETLAAAKSQINRFGMPTAAELQSSNDMIFTALAWPTAQARRARLRGIGYGDRSNFELNFGRYLPSFGRAEDDDTAMSGFKEKGGKNEHNTDDRKDRVG